METKHTPGPWNVCEPSTWPSDTAMEGWRLAAGWQVGIRPGFCIAFVDGENPEQCEANAHLIAAGPEMLAVLKSIYIDLVDYSKRLSGAYDTGAIALGSCADQVAAVIRKAEGEVA